jgi:membrane protein
MTADTGADDDVTDDSAATAPGGPADGDGSGEEDADRAAATEASEDGSDHAAAGATDHAAAGGSGTTVDPDDVAAIDEEVEALREELDALETRIDEKTVHRDDVRSELRRYVRKRQRRGHATGWGPYLVLLYGTVMTVAAFFYLGDLAAIFAMFVIWLSTLGLYVFMAVLGSFLTAGRKAAGLRDLVGKFR